MYLWNIGALRAQLAGDGLTSRQQLGYLVPTLSLIALTMACVPQHNLWSAVFAAAVVVLVASGAGYAYRCNGGGEGRDFLPRFVALALVCGLRWLVFLCVPVTLAVVLIPGTPWRIAWPEEMEPLQLFDVLVRLILVPPYLWSVGQQLRRVTAEGLEVRPATVPSPVDDSREPLED